MLHLHCTSVIRELLHYDSLECLKVSLIFIFIPILGT